MTKIFGLYMTIGLLFSLTYAMPASGSIIFGPESFHSTNSEWASFSRTLSLDERISGKYLLKIRNGHLGPHLYEQCEAFSVYEQKRQCQYDNLVERTDRDFGRVEQTNIYINGKKIKIGTILKSRGYIETPIDLKSTNQLKIDVLSFPTSTIEITIEDFPASNLNPRALYSLNAMSGRIPFTINFNAGDSFDPEGGLLKYEWDFGSGYQLLTAKTSKKYTIVGQYTAKLRVTDPNGGQDEFQAVIVALPAAAPNPATNKHPIAKLSVSLPDPSDLRKIHLSSAGSYDPDGTITKTEINFGDGTKVTSTEADHTYQQDGTYLVSIKATDNLSASTSVQKSISVAASSDLTPESTVYGPKIFHGSFKSQDIFKDTLSVTAPETQALYRLTIKNADGLDHPIQNCSMPWPGKLACLFSNLIERTYISFNRVDWANVYINSKQLTDSSSINKSKYLFQTYVKLGATNKIETRLKGWPTSYIQVSIEKMAVATDTTPPLIAADVSSGQTTNKKTVTVTITEIQSVTSEVLLNGIQILSSPLKQFQFDLAEGANDFQLTSRDQSGNEATPLVVNGVTLDSIPPTIASNVPAQIYVQYLPYQLLMQAQLTEIGDLTVNGQFIGASMTDFIGLVALPNAGQNTLQMVAKDLAGNVGTLSLNTEVIQDNVAPTISFGIPDRFKTNSADMLVPITIVDQSPINATLTVNGVESLQTGAKNFDGYFFLPSEGENTLEVSATDAAGNISTTARIIIIKDTTAPVLSNLGPDGNFDRISFDLHGQSNEPLSRVVVNGMTLAISTDGLSFSANYIADAQGVIPFHWVATDLSGNVTEADTLVNINSRLLIPELVKIVPDKDGQHVYVQGGTSATRPNVEVTAREGLLSLNRETTQSNGQGSFSIQLSNLQVVDLVVTDPNTGEVATATIRASSQTVLAGQVMDTSGNPLLGATISIQGRPESVFTDSSGIFVLQGSFSGDQLLAIDGTSVPLSTDGPYKDFAKTNVSISLASGKYNTLTRPIYLAPLISDGTETDILPGQSAVVTSGAAPGVKLQIPADKVTFPDGTADGSINIASVDSQMSTTPVLQVATPTKVIALEPSGLAFKTRVPIQFPNDNDLPPGVELAILSMNSTKGIWEVDGTAKVSADGQSIVSKPGEGISHFSLVYAVPISPIITDVKDPNLIGVDISKGSLSTSVDLPSFKALGQNSSIGLVYKSSWANPTAYVSNMFDIPKQETKFKYTSAANGPSSIQDVTTCFSNGGGCSVDRFYLDSSIEQQVEGTAWYVPDSIKSQFFISSLASNQVDYVDSNFTQPNSTSYLDGTRFRNSVPSSIVAYSGIPYRSFISYAVPLMDQQSGDYLATGIYPTLSRYEIRLRNMILRTATSKVTIRVNGEIQDVRISQDTRTETRQIETLMPKDLQSSVIVQNKVASPVGRGWKLGLGQHILNPENDQIVIEESDGSLSSYVVNNQLTTLLDLSGTKFEPEWGVGLNHWPYAYIPLKNRTNEVAAADITQQLNDCILSGSPQSACAQSVTSNSYIDLQKYNLSDGSKQNSGPINTGAGWQYFGDTSTCSYGSNSISGTLALSGTGFVTTPKIGQVVEGPDGSVFGVNTNENYIFQISATNFSGISLTPSLASLPAIGINGISSYSNYQDACLSQGRTCASLESIGSRSCSSYTGTTSWGLQTFGHRESTSTDYEWPEFAYDTNFTPSIQSTGSYWQPSAIAISPMGVLAVADTANHMIRGLDTTRKTVFTIAGVGPSDPPDAGDGGPATLSGIFHPRGVAYDQDGNLFVSSERGLIRKIDTAGTISTFAGLPLEEGGILANEGLATTMALNKPLGLVVDNAKKLLYVAETGAQRVVRIDMVTKLASVVAGTGNCDLSQAGDGLPALQVSLCDPTYLGLDDGGNLIIVDSGHKKIRRVIFGSSSAGTLAFNPTNKDLSKLTRNNDGTWTRVYRNGTQVVFDSRGLQTSARDRVGNTSSLAYDSDGNLTTFVDSAGQTTTMSYSGGKLLSIQDPASRTTTFTYSGNLLTQISLPDGTSKTFNYDNNGQMTNETNQRGLTTKYEYNAYNRLGKVTDSDNKEVIVTDMVTQSMSNSYTGGATGQLVSSGFGPTKVNDKVVDARSVSTELAVNFQGAITKIKDGKGQVTTVDRNLDGDPVGVTYPDNSKVSFTYDPTTRDLLSRTDIGTGIVESKTYDYFGNILTQTDGNGRVTSKVYDPTSGILISEIAPGGIRVVYTYTTKGLLASRTVFPTGAIALTTQYEYDGRGNLSRSIAADGIQTQYVSDLAGNTTQVIKQTSAGTTAVTNYAYDLTNRLIRVITANGETTEYSYLPTGELSQIKDPKGKFQSFEYDRKGRLVKKTDTSGKVYTMSYDGNGNVVQQTDPNGNVKTYAYDEINKLITAQYPDDQITYQYSLKGDLTQITNRNSSVAYGYDTKGRTTYQKMVGVGTLSDYPQVDMISSYDGVGNRTSLATPLATFSYIYDSANRLNNISSTLGDSFNFGYDLANRLTQVGRPGSQTNFSYAASGVINSIIHSAGGTTKSFAQYQYDLRNYPIQKTTPAGTSNFSYDGNGQLLSATGVTGSENYNYDSIGNRLSDTTTSYGYDSNAQRLLDDGVYNYSYDENGNLISKIPKDSSQNAIIYGYSSKNQLVHIQITATALGAVIKDTKYTYDVLGRRIEKRVTDTTGPIAVKVRRYVYDGDSILFEYDESSLLATHTHSQLSADDVLGTTVTSAGAIAGVSTSPGHFYFLKDALGSLTDIINSSGTVIQKYEYSAFGKIRSITDATGVDITSSPLLNAAFTFTGRELDDESGLYYYRARYYDPQLGRFLQVDPHPGRIQNPASSNNRYSYALNNPTTYRDPSGKDIWDEFGKVATITAAVVAGVFAGGAAAAYLGVSGVLGALVGASAGSVVGGLIGALGFAVSHADPREGLRLGAIAGGLSGILGGSGLINVSVNVKTVSPTDVFNGILGRAENSGGIDVAKAAEAMANDPFLGGAAKLAISGLPYITPAIAHSILVSEDQCLAGGSCGGINVPVYDNGGHSF